VSAGAAAPVQTPPVVRDRTEWLQERAGTALRRAQALTEGGDKEGALRWFERAHRIAPADAVIRLALAGARAASGRTRAAADLLEPIAGALDRREIWITLASLQFRLGAAESAAASLMAALAGHALPLTPAIARLAGSIARQSGHPGWCALGDDGRLRVEPRAGAEVVIDGIAFRDLRRAPPADARMAVVSLGGRPLLGSPLRLAHIRRVEGIVQAEAGRLWGWAWHPSMPERDPELHVTTGDGRGLRLTARDQEIAAPGPLARARGFRVGARRLGRAGGLVSVRGIDGRDLLGSPLDPAGTGEPPRAAADRGPAARAPARPGRPAAIVVPVHGREDLVEACLASVLETLGPRDRVVIVDDASPGPAMAGLLGRIAADRRVRVLRAEVNEGFPAAANRGITAALALPGGPDIVLLNSDTLVPAGWVEALRAAVHAAPDIGTATPFSNDATILSYPDAAGGNPAPGRAALHRLARQAARANGGTSIDIPTAVGFCMYVRRECLAEIGLFRPELFAQGYGEENDFCLRARHRGWRHVGVPGAYVAHVGGQSFGAARGRLIERNLHVLEELYPGYHALIAAFGAADPLADARRRLDLSRWRASRGRGPAALLVTHDSGGGVARVVAARAAALRAEGIRPIVLRSQLSARGKGEYVHGLCRVERPGDEGFPNLRFRLPAEGPALLSLLRGERATLMEVHHLLGHDHSIMDLPRRLGIPHDIHVHDYAAVCPRVSLIGREGRYCGEPEDTAACDACVAATGRVITEALPTARLRARSASDFAKARRIVVPSGDVAARLRRYVHQFAPVVEPLEHDGAHPALRPILGPVRHVGVIGAIGVEKGFDVLLACAEDARARRLDLRFTVIGHTADDDRLLETGHVFVTGPYQEAEAVDLIRDSGVQLAWQPSIWPETWCFTIGLAWQAGLGVAAFDLGAPSERIRRAGRGWLMPLGLPPAAINSLFLGLGRVGNGESAQAGAYQPAANPL
jgi:GT2 family glycosyltransferase/glycosyltransferase involved in cell wall biosynthesis